MCKQVEEVFGWVKTVAVLVETRHRGLGRVGWQFTLTLVACNLVRLPKLLAPLFEATLRSVRQEVDAEIGLGIDISIPKNLSGGYTYLPPMPECVEQK